MTFFPALIFGLVFWGVASLKEAAQAAPGGNRALLVGVVLILVAFLLGFAPFAR